jgi:tRNA(Ile)-lysidine synthase TilS/MesJ
MHKLQQHFLDILGEYNIVSSHESPLLLAISGGKDSMVLLHIAHSTLLQ